MGSGSLNLFHVDSRCTGDAYHGVFCLHCQFNISFWYLAACLCELSRQSCVRMFCQMPVQHSYSHALSTARAHVVIPQARLCTISLRDPHSAYEMAKRLGFYANL